MKSTPSLRKPVGVVYSAVTLASHLSMEQPVVKILSSNNMNIMMAIGDNNGNEAGSCPNDANEYDNTLKKQI